MGTITQIRQWEVIDLIGRGEERGDHLVQKRVMQGVEEAKKERWYKRWYKG
jgi:hypothetical protein